MILSLTKDAVGDRSRSGVLSPCHLVTLSPCHRRGEAAMPDEPRVQELLAELLDRQATPEEVCGVCLELLPVVRERWRQICRARAELDALFPICPHGSLPTT